MSGARNCAVVVYCISLVRQCRCPGARTGTVQYSGRRTVNYPSRYWRIWHLAKQPETKKKIPVIEVLYTSHQIFSGAQYSRRGYEATILIRGPRDDQMTNQS
jgi:hypothetical protein